MLDIEDRNLINENYGSYMLENYRNLIMFAQISVLVKQPQNMGTNYMKLNYWITTPQIKKKEKKCGTAANLQKTKLTLQFRIIERVTSLLFRFAKMWSLLHTFQIMQSWNILRHNSILKDILGAP